MFNLTLILAGRRAKLSGRSPSFRSISMRKAEMVKINKPTTLAYSK